ncbi:hypothetical protein CHL78_005530 [Romboutsia weinsteinii]|uniref:Uncharacterized protein n=1 Tax=Romboutsia weinsteinii TaxID=2020949 RepID=A0A371J6Q2_9FIRM|nr:hypothetical protein CHL78_005530 [Romboutsia weinsteinii]
MNCKEYLDSNLNKSVAEKRLKEKVKYYLEWSNRVFIITKDKILVSELGDRNILKSYLNRDISNISYKTCANFNKCGYINIRYRFADKISIILPDDMIQNINLI